jgi:hypothetical protein
MNVEIRVEAALLPEKEYINGFFVAVWALYRFTNSGSLQSNMRQEIYSLEK